MKYCNFVNNDRIKEEIGFLKLLFTVFSAVLATLTGFIWKTILTTTPALLAITVIVDCMMFAILAMLTLRIFKLIKSL